MKTMTCKQLGGACNKEFQANTFEEISELSKQHGMEMFQSQDKLHLEAMFAIQELIKKPDSLKEWMQSKKDAFDSLPEEAIERVRKLIEERASEEE